MLKVERQKKILELLERTDSVLVTDLSQIFKCSDETIRRDLKEMEKSKLLTRTHGGAFKSTRNDKTYPSKIRNVLLLNEKIKISKKAMDLIQENDFIFLDSSTTCFQLAKFIIKAKINLTIATNSILITNLCTQEKNNIDLIMIGGYLRNNNMSTIGVEGINQISNYFADKCILSPPKVSLDKGLFGNNILEANIRKSMIAHASSTIVLADHTKFKSITNYKISTMDKIDKLISDKNFSEEEIDLIKKYKIDSIRA